VHSAIRLGELTNSALTARRLGDPNRVIVASPGYQSAHKTPGVPV